MVWSSNRVSCSWASWLTFRASMFSTPGKLGFSPTGLRRNEWTKFPCLAWSPVCKALTNLCRTGPWQRPA
eukprot:2313155-Prorocentrum_lima.AAC.1